MCLFKLVVFSVVWDLFSNSPVLRKESFLTLNRILCVASILIYIIANLHWVYLQEKLDLAITIESHFLILRQKNWYCVLFATPAFFLGGNLKNEKKTEMQKKLGKFYFIALRWIPLYENFQGTDNTNNRPFHSGSPTLDTSIAPN